MAHQQTDTKTLLLSVIEEYSHSDMTLGPQVHSLSQENDYLEILAHAHIHAAMALMKEAGLSHQQVAEAFYIHADIQATRGVGL